MGMTVSRNAPAQQPASSRGRAGGPRPIGGVSGLRGAALTLRPAEQAGRRNILVIYNPTAGWRRRGRFRKTLRHLARLGCVVTVRETLAQGEAKTFAAEGAGQGYDAIVVAGGDGTINEAAGALAFTSERVAVIPIGTANVLAGELGLPSKPEAVAQTIVNGAERAIHIGRLGERHFMMMAGVGFDARVVAAMETGLKSVLGKYAYVVAARFVSCCATSRPATSSASTRRRSKLPVRSSPMAVFTRGAMWWRRTPTWKSRSCTLSCFFGAAGSRPCFTDYPCCSAPCRARAGCESWKCGQAPSKVPSASRSKPTAIPPAPCRPNSALPAAA